MDDEFFERLDQIDDLIVDADFDAAREAVDEARDEFGDEPELLVADAEVAFEAGAYEECIEKVDSHLDEVAEQFGADLLVLKGDALFYSDRESTARRTFNRAIGWDVTWGALLGRAQVHEFLDYPHAALLDLDRAIELDDQEAEPFSLRGSIRLELGEREEAKSDFETTLELDPHDEEARLQLARLEAAEGNASGAIELLEPLVEEGWDEDVVFPAALLRSQMSLSHGSTEAALEDAQTAIDLRPDAPWGYLQRAAAHLHASRPGDAMETLEAAEERAEQGLGLADLHSLRVSAYEQLGKPEMAETTRQKIEGTPQLPEIVYGSELNPADDVPEDPNRPLDTRTVLEEVFGDPDLAPPGYADKVRELLDRVPQLQQQHPEAGEIEIELPPVQEGGESPGQIVLELPG